jgi:hypothetical protein
VLDLVVAQLVQVELELAYVIAAVADGEIPLWCNTHDYPLLWIGTLRSYLKMACPFLVYWCLVVKRAVR